MAGTLKRIAGPAYLANAAADIYTPPASTIYTVIFQIHFANKASASTFTLYVGGTGGSAGGTELFPTKALAAADTYDWYAPAGLKLISTDFLSGLAGAASTIVIIVMGQQFVV